MRALLINEKTQVVDNVIELPDDYVRGADGAYVPPEGFTLIISDERVEPGSKKINGVWVIQDSQSQGPPSILDRVLNLENELNEMKSRASTIQVSDPDVIKVRDAVVGERNN